MKDNLTLQHISQILNDAVINLAPQARKIYELSRNKGYTIKEIAAHLSISEQTVKNTLSRSLQTIKQKLLANGIELPFLIISYWLLQP